MNNNLSRSGWHSDRTVDNSRGWALGACALSKAILQTEVHISSMPRPPLKMQIPLQYMTETETPEKSFMHGYIVIQLGEALTSLCVVEQY